MPVIKDVAKLAGVSVGTVSKFINNSQNLKPLTMKKVEDAIKILNYTPSPLARSMRTGKTNNIVVITPDITNPFFAEIYDAIRSNTVKDSYIPILFTTQDDLISLEKYLINISKRQIDGIILCFVDENEIIQPLIDQIHETIPMVLLSWNIHNKKFNSVSIDVLEGCYKSTKYLISNGCKNIGYIGGNIKNKISSQKFLGYETAMREANLKINTEFIYRKDFTMNTGYNGAKVFSTLKILPDAIVTENDILGIGSIKYFIQNNIKVPQDVAIIGFDNIMLSSMYEPALSTISIPIKKMGQEAVKLLIDEINEPASIKKQIILESKLIIRNSTSKYHKSYPKSQ